MPELERITNLQDGTEPRKAPESPADTTATRERAVLFRGATWRIEAAVRPVAHLHDRDGAVRIAHDPREPLALEFRRVDAPPDLPPVLTVGGLTLAALQTADGAEALLRMVGDEERPDAAAWLAELRDAATRPPRTILTTEPMDRFEPPDGPGDAIDQLPPPTWLWQVAPDPVRFAVDGLLLDADLNLVVGDGGAGKSTLLYHVAACMATGTAVFGRYRVERPGPVLLIGSGEDDGALVLNRLHAFAAGLGITADAVDEAVALYNGVGLSFDDPRWVDRLIAAIRELGAVAWFADPLADLIGDGAEENSNSDARRITRALRRVVLETGAPGVIAHHATKPTEGAQRRHRVRGASAWLNAVRMAWWAEPQSGGVELTPIKANRLASRQPIRLRLTVDAEYDNALMWRRAELVADTSGDVASEDVLLLLRLVRDAATPPTSRALKALFAEAGIGGERAGVAIAAAEHHGWTTFSEGPRRAKLWQLTDAGRARVALG